MTNLPFLFVNVLNVLTWAAMIGVLVWVFRLTRLPAVATYLAWFLVSQAIVRLGHELVIDAGTNTGAHVALVSGYGNIISTGLLIWLVVSLVRWADPGSVLPWKSSRVLPVPVKER
jgi:hypothetical protein